MRNEMEYVTCPGCGSIVPKVKFCVECGGSLEGAKPAEAPRKEAAPPPGVRMPTYSDGRPAAFSTSVFVQPAAPAEPPRKALSDEGLTLLVNTCQKTMATVGGDGYSEIVLYLDESTGAHWLHTYSKYVYMPEEAHASYIAAPELAKSVLNYIEEHDLASWKDNRGFPMVGGDYILRFRHGGEMIRLDSGKMMDGQRAYSDISGMLYAGATEENRRYAEE